MEVSLSSTLAYDLSMNLEQILVSDDVDVYMGRSHWDPYTKIQILEGLQKCPNYKLCHS